MKERNITLDYFKIILSILVINIHAPFVSIYPPTDSGFWSQLGYVSGWFFSHGITKIAVPLFFIINGFFLDLSNTSKVIKYIKRLFIMYIAWALFYLPMYYPYLDTATFIRVFATGFFHLWYLPGLIGAIVILFFVNKIIKNKIILILIAIILFGIGYMIQMKDPYTNVEMIKYRNCLFFGFPFVLFGYLLKTFNIKQLKSKVIILITIGFVFLMSESYLYMIQQKTNNLMFSLLILCPALFIFVLQHSKTGIDKSEGVISQLSTAVYYIHPMVLRWTSLLFAVNIISFPYIVITSLVTGVLLIKCNKYFKILL